MDHPVVTKKELRGLRQLSAFIDLHSPFLFKDSWFRVADSREDSSFGGDCYVILESGKLRLRFVSDRSQLFLGFAAQGALSDGRWYSIDIVRQLITGEEEYYSLVDEDNIQFLKENLPEIEHLFSSPALKQVYVDLKTLERKRSKKLFG